MSEPDAEALYELVALTDGTWATWDPRLVRELALQDAELAVGSSTCRPISRWS